MDPSSASSAKSINKSELKNQELVVGAWRFELQTSCAQGRRAPITKNSKNCKGSILSECAIRREQKKRGC